MSDRQKPVLTVEEINTYSRKLTEENTESRSTYLMRSERIELIVIKGQNRLGIDLSSSALHSTEEFLKYRSRSSRKRNPQSDPRYASVINEANQGGSTMVTILRMAMTPPERSGDAAALATSTSRYPEETGVDAITQANDFLRMMAIYELAREDLSNPNDPSYFSLLHTYLGFMREAGVRRSISAVGAEDLAEWYKGIYMLGYRANLGPAPRISL